MLVANRAMMRAEQPTLETSHRPMAKLDMIVLLYTDQQLGEFCKDYGVDIEYDKDRVAFFTALVKEMKYQ